MKHWLENCWYQFGWSAEVSANRQLVRQILDLPILVWRDGEGRLAAVLDMCPHRFAPLSAGKFDAGTVTCGYHGLAFRADGSCAHNPFGPVTSTMKVRSFPLIERHTAIWIWMGKGEPDPATVPDLFFIDQTPETARIQGYLPTNADYRLVVDNIMDLSHADYLHPSTLGGIMVRANATSRVEGDTVIARWDARDCDPPAAFRLAIPDGKRADVTIEVEWHSPALMKLSTCAVAAGTQPQPHDYGLTLHNMTPADASRTHYFYCNTRKFLTDDRGFTELLRDTITRAFVEEDKPMLELQQQRIGSADFWDLSPILLKSDAAAVRVRRKLEELIEGECS